MTRDIIEQKLRAAFAPTFLEVTDDSHRHIGHGEGYKVGGGSHLTITMVSSRFSDLGRIARHQMVYGCLEDALRTSVHALCLKLYSPEEKQAASPAGSPESA